MDHQKAQAAKLRGWNTTMVMNETAIPDINWWIANFRANIPAQLIQIPPQITMTTDAEPNKRSYQATKGKSRLQLKAYEVSQKPQRIRKINPQ
ncbi:MAG: hypothetical protein EZS28_018062 [Streblomastix strix]|uniref:Uncharacterized protein n=1 Tax=Streblomastix strix TaxID=222440 RepID=A0A5J4VV63_9EUKA|nr:MAG: hypothetical protein EZS28_018062 [Streblomastix strix]